MNLRSQGEDYPLFYLCKKDNMMWCDVDVIDIWIEKIEKIRTRRTKLRRWKWKTVGILVLLWLVSWPLSTISPDLGFLLFLGCPVLILLILVPELFLFFGCNT